MIKQKDRRKRNMIYLVGGVIVGFTLMYGFLTAFPEYKLSNQKSSIDTEK